MTSDKKSAEKWGKAIAEHMEILKSREHNKILFGTVPLSCVIEISKEIKKDAQNET